MRTYAAFAVAPSRSRCTGTCACSLQYRRPSYSAALADACASRSPTYYSNLFSSACFISFDEYVVTYTYAYASSCSCTYVFNCQHGLRLLCLQSSYDVNARARMQRAELVTATRSSCIEFIYICIHMHVFCAFHGHGFLYMLACIPQIYHILRVSNMFSLTNSN